jgi:hypothetical protein
LKRNAPTVRVILLRSCRDVSGLALERFHDGWAGVANFKECLVLIMHMAFFRVNERIPFSRWHHDSMLSSLEMGNVKVKLLPFPASLSTQILPCWISTNLVVDDEKEIRDILLSALTRAGFSVEKVEKILFNLVSNAMKFTPEHGEVSISVKDLGFHFLLLIFAVRKTPGAFGLNFFRNLSVEGYRAHSKWALLKRGSVPDTFPHALLFRQKSFQRCNR